MPATPKSKAKMASPQAKHKDSRPRLHRAARDTILLCTPGTYHYTGPPYASNGIFPPILEPGFPQPGLSDSQTQPPLILAFGPN